MSNFITNEEFTALTDAMNRLTLYADPAIRWRDLPLNTIYKIEHSREVLSNDVATIILTVVDREGDKKTVWATSRLSIELRKRYLNKTNVYIRSLGKKECKTMPGRLYYDYEIVQLKSADDLSDLLPSTWSQFDDNRMELDSVMF